MVQMQGIPRRMKVMKDLIRAIVEAGGVKYEYVNIDPVNNAGWRTPNANIRVGFLYNPERVSLTEGIPHGDATTAVGYENGKLTHNPGRIDPNDPAFNSSRKPLAAQFDFQGESRHCHREPLEFEIRRYAIIRFNTAACLWQ